LCGFFDGVHIRCCGHGGLWVHPYGGSLGKTECRPTPSNQGLLSLTFGASPWLGMPSLRSCSVGPPPSMPGCPTAQNLLSASRAGVHRNSARGGLYRSDWFFMRTHFPVGAVECNEAAIFWLYNLQTRSKDRSLRQLLRSDTSAKSGRPAGLRAHFPVGAVECNEAAIIGLYY